MILLLTSPPLHPNAYTALHFLVHFREAATVVPHEITLTVGDTLVTTAASTASSTISITLAAGLQAWMKKRSRKFLDQLRKLKV
jgi:hypothetical protein